MTISVTETRRPLAERLTLTKNAEANVTKTLCASGPHLKYRTGEVIGK